MENNYENYDSVYNDYDKNRTFYNLDIIIGNILMLNLKNIRILDVGCGTGNFLMGLQQFFENSKVLNDLNIEYYGIEPSPKMLKKAKSKKIKNSKFQVGIAEKLPYQDKFFNIIICNQVLHHIIDEGKNKYGRLQKCFKEMKRVLKKNGAIILDDSTQEQVNGFWYSRLIPNAAKKMKKRFLPNDLILDNFNKLGFNSIDITVNKSEILYKDLYYDLDGPFKKEWRNTDSIWSLASPNELKKGLEMWSNMTEKERINFLEMAEKIRLENGQTTFYVIMKL